MITFAEAIFSAVEAKNVGDAGHRRGFLTKDEEKIASAKGIDLMGSTTYIVYWRAFNTVNRDYNVIDHVFLSPDQTLT